MTNRMALVPLDKKKPRGVFSIIRVKSRGGQDLFIYFFFIEERKKDQFVFQQKD